MNKKIELLKLQIKAAFSSVPKIIMGTVILGAVVVLLGFGITMAQNEGEEAKKLQIAIVYSEGDNDKYVKMAIDFVGEVETVNKVCSFTETTKEEALKGLKDDKYTVAIILPPNMIEDILSGVNTPIEAVYKDEGINNSSMILREMLNSAGSDLSSAEAGIYSLDDLYIGLLKKYRSERPEHERTLNEIYFSYALERSIYFGERDLSKKDGLTTFQYYTCTVIVLLLILSGITCANNLKRESNALSMVLKTQGIHSIETGIARVTGLTLVYFVLLMAVFLIAIVMGKFIPVVGDTITISGFFEFITSMAGLFVLIFAVFSFIYCIFRVVGNPVYSVITLFFLGMIFMFASGCFISSALLPKAVSMIGKWLPTAGYFKLAGEVIKGTVGLWAILINIFISAAFLGVAALTEKYQRNR